MVVTGPSALPLPPFDLAWRVGPLDLSDPLGDYQRIGQRIHEQLLVCLPGDWTWKGKRVLDLGCGAGRVLRHLIPYVDQGAELHGCDIHTPSIEWLNDHLSPAVHAFTNGARPPLPLPDDSLDLVIATSVFTHIYRGWSEWLLELDRVLAPGGLLLVTYLGSGMSDELRDLTGHSYDAAEIGILALGCGDNYEWTNVWHGPWWLQTHWGRAFEILELQEDGFADRPGKGHGWVLMRSRGSPLQPEDLERPDDSQLAHELRASELNVSALFDGPTQLLAQRDTLARELAELRGSLSWRLTGPVRRAGSVVRRPRRPSRPSPGSS